MGDMEKDLPYVDEHSIAIAAPRDRVWGALQSYVTGTLATPRRHLLSRALGAQPPSGFRVEQEDPEERLTLAGLHRFARYSLVFELESRTAVVTLLRARTYATFPGPHGGIYRILVIGTRAHVLATKRMLHAVRRMGEAPIP